MDQVHFEGYKPVDELARALLSFKRSARPHRTATVAYQLLYIQNYFRDLMLLMLGVDGVLLSDYCTQTALLNPAPSTNFSDCVPHFPVISSQKSQHSNKLLPKLPTTLPSLPTRTQPTLVRCLTHSTLSLQRKFSSFSLPFHQKPAQWISSLLF